MPQRKRKARTSSARDERDIDKIKRLALVAMFADDELLEQFTLKGGNAIDLIYGAGARASFDLDLSMEHAFPQSELEEVRRRIEIRLKQLFEPAGYEIFDVELTEQPESVTEDLAAFWGGYLLEFKLIERLHAEALGRDLASMRRDAVPVGPRLRRRFHVDISKHEYCVGRREAEIDGYNVYVYSPTMIVCEKLRAICQQTERYARVVRRRQSARARDFFDIHRLIEHFRLILDTPENMVLLKAMFDVKRVPLSLLGEIESYRELHRGDWDAVRDTVRPGTKLREFDYYFDFVVSLGLKLHPRGDV